MFNFFKKSKKQFQIKQIDAKLIFFIYTYCDEKYILQFNIKSIKNINHSIIALVQNKNNSIVCSTDIRNMFLSDKYITFDLSNLNKFTYIYFHDGNFTVERPLENKYIYPCGVVTCKIASSFDQIQKQSLFCSLRKKLLNYIIESLPTEILNNIKE